MLCESNLAITILCQQSPSIQNLGGISKQFGITIAYVMEHIDCFPERIEVGNKRMFHAIDLWSQLITRCLWVHKFFIQFIALFFNLAQVLEVAIIILVDDAY